jgi:hypothetical protein
MIGHSTPSILQKYARKLKGFESRESTSGRATLQTIRSTSLKFFEPIASPSQRLGRVVKVHPGVQCENLPPPLPVQPQLESSLP